MREFKQRKMSDPYSILGVDRNATDEEIKKAYRTLSRKYHPDANINNPHKDEAEAKFKEVQQAYQQIMDERERGYSSGSSYGNSGADMKTMVHSEALEDTVRSGAMGPVRRTARRARRMSISAQRRITYAADIIRKL